MRSERMQGHEWEAYVALDTFLSDGTWDGLRGASPRVTECHSTRGGDGPPGDTGEPCTGGSGTGGWVARSCKVREMRNADAALAIVRGYSKKATGELIDTETVTISSEGGREKRRRHPTSLAAYPTSGTVLEPL